MARRNGFTLIEVLAVVIVLAVIAGVVISTFQDSTLDANASASARIVRIVQEKVNEETATTGTIPPRINRAWFADRQLPKNPFVPDHAANANSDLDAGNNPNKIHPVEKTTVNHPFWYNPANGQFRARVPAQATVRETLELYYRANGFNSAANAARLGGI